MFFFFFNDTATTEIYTLSLHDALPIFHGLANCSRYSSISSSRRVSSASASSLRKMMFTAPSGPITATSAVGHAKLKSARRSEEHTSELQSQSNLVCRLLLEKKKYSNNKLRLISNPYLYYPSTHIKPHLLIPRIRFCQNR